MLDGLHSIIKILVPTLYYTLIIRGVGGNKFEDPMQSDQDMRKIKYGRRRFTSKYPLSKVEFLGTANQTKLLTQKNY